MASRAPTGSGSLPVSRRSLAAGLLAATLAGVAAPAVAQVPPSGCRILLTNDDGVNAPGILAAYRQLSTVCETVISAPATDQSGASHAIINTRGGTTVRRIVLAGGVPAYAVEGSPAEAVAIGLHAFGAERQFDLVISGVNRGENLGLGNLYSGTVNAAMEAVLRGTPSIAVSQAGAYGGDYERGARFARTLAALALRRPLPAGTMLNVNIPHGRIRGIRVVRAGLLSTVLRGFDAVPAGPGVTVYTPRISRRERAPEAGDVRDYLAGYVTIVPLALDRTAAREIPALGRWASELRAPGND